MYSIEKVIERLAAAALDEDAARGDATTPLLVGAGAAGRAAIKTREEGIISGQDCAAKVFALLDPRVSYLPVERDGSRAGPGVVVARVEGPLAPILSGERTALNFLQRLSGIATLTSRFVEAVEGTGVIVLDTRKTTPGMRLLEKRAVSDGGGMNHRRDLASMILVKENHIAAAGGIGMVCEALGAVRLAEAEIEVRSIEELRLLRRSPPRRVMLDNFDPGGIDEAVREMSSWSAVPEVEVSGGVSLERIAEFARPGVDFISIGALTSSAKALDLTLIVEEIRSR